MIQQHYLQQQRLNYNHDRLLDRYNRLLSPRISEFRAFGTSSLPGRNYDQYLDTIQGDGRRRNSVVAHSRARIGSSNEIYRLMGDGASETLPRNVNSIMQHSRSQSIPLVHAEKFEPVQFYEHPLYGPTPSYLRPVVNDRQHSEERDNVYSDKDESGDEVDIDIRSRSSRDSSLKLESKRETQVSLSTGVKDDDHDDNRSPERAPRGYISYKKWKAKYGNLIPVDPLLFNIYTKRRNGSINKYGQSLYASPSHHRRSSLDDDLLFTTNSSEIESITSELPHETSLSSHQRYHRLQKPFPSRSLEPIHTESESSDNEASPPDSPVPYLSRNKQNSSISTPFITTTSSPPFVTTSPARSLINTGSSTSLITTNPATPLITTRSPTPLTTHSSSAPLVTTSSSAPLTTTSSSTSLITTRPATTLIPSSSSTSLTTTSPATTLIPSSSSTSLTTISPATTLTTTRPTTTLFPSSSSTSLTTTSPATTLTTTRPTATLFPSSSSTSLTTTSPATPIVPPINRVTARPSTLNRSVGNTIGTSPTALASTNTSNIPPAPPLPPSLAITQSTTRYATPSSVPITSSPRAFSTTSTSTVPYQALSNISGPPPSAPSLAGSTTKAVTFARISSTGATNDDVSSSSDSEDEEKQRRRRHRKKQAAVSAGVDIDSSSSDD